MSEPSLLNRLRADLGRSGTPKTARDPVHPAVIRTWCDAMSETNPYFTDPVAAAAGPHGSLVAPPAMLQVWTMPGLSMGAKPPSDPADPAAGVYQRLDDAGFTSVVATDTEHHYVRHLRPGDLITGVTTLAAVSEEKQTALGIGHFVTTEVAYSDQHGRPVGTMVFRILKFRPGSGRQPDPDPRHAALIDVGLDPDTVLGPQPRPTRPRPVWNQDQAWFWEGLRAHELRIQRFPGTGALAFPPANADPLDHSTQWDWIVASGKGTLYSYTVPHHPRLPAFDQPLVVGLVELDEGVRLVSNIVGVRPDQLEIGMPLEVCFPPTNSAPDVTLHQFRPATPVARSDTRRATDLEPGDPLPLCCLTIDPLLIVSSALATRDFQDVHHDPDLARAKGSKDIFMNILTTAGLCNRWVGSWAGPDADFASLKIRLGAPNYPGDMMTFSGSVASVASDGAVSIEFVGTNSLGPHVTGTVDLLLPDR